MKQFILSETPGVMFIPREESTQVLTEAFTQMFGKEFRQMFEEHAEVLVNIGIEHGKKLHHAEGLDRTKDFHIHYKFAKDSEKKVLIQQLEEFFTPNEVKILSEDLSLGMILGHRYPGMGTIQQVFIDKLTGVKLKNMTPSFKYFKQFKLYRGSNLYGESGLCLDTWKKPDFEYYLDEGEFFYYIEDISLKYCKLGSFIGRNELKEDWMNKGIELITPETSYWVVSAFKHYLDKISSDFEEENLINIVRDNYFNRYGVKLESLKTHKEIHESLKNLSPEKEKELLDALSKINFKED